MKSSQPYQPLLLRLLHGLTGLFLIAAIVTAYWTYDTYDGRWGSLSWPKFAEIEGIHGTFGLFTLLIFPAFVLYAFHRGQRRLVQPDSLKKLLKLTQPSGWYALNRIGNTFALLALTFALFSGKMMDETWLPRGELNHVWYYAHLVSWVVMVVAIALHLLLNAKVGGMPLLLSMLHWQFRPKDSPVLWWDQVAVGWSQFRWQTVAHWLGSVNGLMLLELGILISIAAAWIIGLLKL